MYAYCLDMPGVTEEMAGTVDAGVGDEPISGLVAHVSGPSEVGWRIIDVWESEEDFHRFQAERLNPAVQSATQGLSAPQRPFESRTVQGVETPATRA